MTDNEHIKDFIAFQMECPESIPFNKEVKFNKVNFKYADLGAIMKIVKPLANKFHFVVYHEINNWSVSAVLLHVGGDQFKSTVHIKEGLQSKEKGSEITYAKRYSLSALCGIVTEDDRDTPEKTKIKLNKAQFEAVCLKIKNGDKDAFNKCLLYFDVTEEQEHELKTIDLDCYDR